MLSEGREKTKRDVAYADGYYDGLRHGKQIVRDEPTLKDLAIEAAAFLESVASLNSERTVIHAKQMAFALRACVNSEEERERASTTKAEES